MNIFDNFLKSSNTNLKLATSEKLDLTNPEDVVLALGYAYAYMYHRADDQKESEAALSKYHELYSIYDMSTGKPKTKDDDKKSGETWTEFRLNQLEIATANLVNNCNEALRRIDSLENELKLHDTPDKLDALYELFKSVEFRIVNLERWKSLFTEGDK